MKNLLVIGAVTVVILGAGVIVVGEKQIRKTEFQPSLITTPTQIISTASNEEDKKQEQSYSVEIKSPPTYNFYGFTYTATLKNILVTPFVTNFGFYECNFSDKDRNKYSGMISDQNAFTKAIFPGESKEFTAKDVTVNISGLEHTIEGLRRCSYNEKGENVCKLINDLKIIDCTGYISTDGKGAGGAYGGSGGQFPVKVVFPTP